MSDSTVRVAVADDHYLVREGLRQLLELDGEVQVAVSVGTAVELLAALEHEPVEVVVTDIRMPPGHHLEGIEAAHTIRERYPEVGVVVLSAHADAAYALELFRAGTAGLAYLLKDRVGDRAELLRAIRATAAGDSVVDPQVVEAMLGHPRRRETSALDRLSPREREVLEQMAAGRSNPAIGQALFLSVSAVEKHVSAIFTKLGLVEERSSHRRVAAVLAYLADR